MKDKRLQRNGKQHLSSNNGRIAAPFNKRRLILENENFDDTISPRHQTSIQDFFCVKGRGVGLTPKPETRRYANAGSNIKNFRRGLNVIDTNRAPATTSSPPALSEKIVPATNTDEEFDVQRPDRAPVVAVIASSPRNPNTPRRTPSPSTCPPHTTAVTTARRRGRRLEQLYLDLGQRDFARPVVCDTCGMLHVHGVEEDVLDHRRMCQVHALGVPLRTERRVVGRPHPDSAVHLIRPGDPPALRRKAEQVRTIVDHDLGLVPPSPTMVAVPIFTYLFARNGRVVGLCDAEPSVRRGRVLPMEESDGAATSAGAATGGGEGGGVNGGGGCAPLHRPAAVGIRRLWVHPRHRRSGVATALLEAVRRNTAFGSVLPATMVAFSSPTEAGARFARQYVRRSAGPSSNALVYK